MGLFLAGLLAAACSFAWLIISITAAINAHKRWGWWTTAYIIFSYYWTHQVLTNVVSVTTAGIIGRWFVLGECTRNFTTGLKVGFLFILNLLLTLECWKTHSFLFSSTLLILGNAHQSSNLLIWQCLLRKSLFWNCPNDPGIV